MRPSLVLDCLTLSYIVLHFILHFTFYILNYSPCLSPTQIRGGLLVLNGHGMGIYVGI